MLRRLKIRNYKSFVDLDLELRPLMVILGPNDSGKSNFLDAIFLLSRFVTAQNLSEAFAEHRGLPLESVFYGDEGYEALLEKEKLHFFFEADVELSDRTVSAVERVILSKREGLPGNTNGRKHVTERFLRYTVEVEVLPKTGHVRVANEQVVAIKRDGNVKSRKPFLEKQGHKLHLRVEGRSHPYYRDLGLEHTVLSESLYEPHFPHLTALRKELESCAVYYLEPRFLMREAVPRKEVRNIGQRGENLAAFLNSLKQTNRPAFNSLQKSVRMALPGEPLVDVELTKEGLVTLTVERGGVRFSSRLISEGTLRVIGLLSALHGANAATVIGYEEPENGVHPVRLTLIERALRGAVERGKQVILTTHSPLFAELFDSEELFVCRRDGMATEIKPFEDLGPLFKQPGIRDALSDLIVQGHLGG